MPFSIFTIAPRKQVPVDVKISEITSKASVLYAEKDELALKPLFWLNLEDSDTEEIYKVKFVNTYIHKHQYLSHRIFK